MAQEYTIQALSQQNPPRNWEGQYGPMVTYTFKVQGDERVLQMNRKPTSPAPQAGDKLYGEIVRKEYNGNVSYQFKSEQRPGGGFGGRGGYQRDDKEIRAQMAVKAATDYCAQLKKDVGNIPDLAATLYGLVDTLKGGSKPDEDLKQDAAKALSGDNLPTDEDLDKPVDLSSIPF